MVQFEKKLSNLELTMKIDKKIRLYGLALWDHSPVWFFYSFDQIVNLCNGHKLTYLMQLRVW